MAEVNYTQQGFIFLNSLGQYAIPGMSTGHGGTREVINWVDNINQAHVFQHEALVRRRFKELEKAQSLKAVVKREVILSNWSAE